MKLLSNVVIILLILQNIHFSQETKKIKNNTIKETAAFEGDIKFTDGTNNLLRITDEGSFGAIQFINGVPDNTNRKLYSDNGKLFYDGIEIKGVGAATDSLNNLLDAKYDGQSLFIGVNAGLNDDGGASDGTKNYNVSLGKNSLRANVDGIGNVAVGYNSIILNQDGDYNTALGNSTLHDNTTGKNNTAIGNQAMYSNIGGEGNVALGKEALYSHTSSLYNVALGAFALKNLNDPDATGNIAIGASALENNISGYTNTAIGYQSGLHNESGSSNIFIGSQAGIYSMCSNSIFIGNGTGNAAGDDNQLIIGHSYTSGYPLIAGNFNTGKVVINGSKTMGNSNYNLYVNGDAGGSNPWNNLSDMRLKKEIVPIPNALEKVKDLRGVNFKWKDPEKLAEGNQIGFIAQEVVDVVPEVVDTSDEYYSMQYAPLTALLVEAVKEQQLIIDELKNQNSQLEKRLNKIERLFEHEKLSQAANSSMQ
ncbi:MAG: tail fiber domain-containing protein [Ignavibacteriales bacterium]|nr:tail fiber domain-containing protein [Ignavibacteriales bacterium]